MMAGNTLAADPIPVIPPAQKVISSTDGRFVFGQINDFRRDQFLLDTKTGRLWKISYEKTNDGSVDGQAVLSPVIFIDAKANRSVEPAK